MSKDDYFQSGKYQRSAKLFITNLPPNLPQEQLRNDIEPLFQKFGSIRSINVKKHKSGQYSYCFLQFERIQDAIRAIQQMDQNSVHDRPMKVRQDRQGDGCFHCKKPGHFAKQCPFRQSGGRDQRRRSRSRDRDRDYQRRHRRQKDRSRSKSYERQRQQRRYRRSRQRQYSPYDYRRREHHRRGGQRHRRSKSPRSRSRSQSYEDRGRYRRREQYQRDERRESRDYNRRRSRSSSYQRRGR